MIWAGRKKTHALDPFCVILGMFSSFLVKVNIAHSATLETFNKEPVVRTEVRRDASLQSGMFLLICDESEMRQMDPQYDSPCSIPSQ